MGKFFNDNWKFLLFVLTCGLIGGFFTGYYIYDLLSFEVLKQLQEQNIAKDVLAIISMIQYGLLYGFILACLGTILSKKVLLWKKFSFNKEAIIVTIIITIIGSLLLFPGDMLIFGPFSDFVNDQYNKIPTISKIISGFLVGGIIEEVMIRLFFMSLVVFIISKIYKKEISIKAYVIANIISALLFAIGHIPSTMSMTTLTPVLLFRCFLLNGLFGLCFGFLYRKYGIGYAIISHGFIHLISDVLVILFI